ncbi:hypothetical protein ACFQZ1_17055 [Bacillus sp. CGMCC 1.60114]|uniref:hypothetical protein n=1 Tax=unclassified Bacillus (in: firmicutes) TaxID=185979 RepID=UPI0036268BF5
MKSRKLILPVIVATSLALGACGTQGEKKAESTKTTEQASEKKTISIADGAASMKQTVSDLKAQLQANNAAKVKDDAEQLEKTWQTFEDTVKEKNADLYGKLETPLDTIGAGAKVQPLDVQTLNKAAEDLDAVLTEVGKLK